MSNELQFESREPSKTFLFDESATCLGTQQSALVKVDQDLALIQTAD